MVIYLMPMLAVAVVEHLLLEMKENRYWSVVVAVEAHKAQGVGTYHSKVLMVLPMTTSMDPMELDIQVVGMKLAQVVPKEMEEGPVSMVVPEAVDFTVVAQTQVQEVIMLELQEIVTLMEAGELVELTEFFMEILLQIFQVDLEVEQVLVVELVLME